MITKFEETGELGELPRRGRKTVGTERVATAVVEKPFSSIYSSANGRSVLRELEISWSTLRKILRYVLKWYPYKIYAMKMPKPQNRKTRLEFTCQFLARMEVDEKS
ncbi:hypothetical protein TNCV_2789401 [Trichonephila clavipes]|nr:hypothetical protein TNCV_2789401 [Trichonephila clavipes]